MKEGLVMNILIAVDSFKGTLSSKEVAEIIKQNIETKDNNIDIVPIADGGEGTVESLMHATNGVLKTVKVQDAFGSYNKSHYCLTNRNKTAIVEIALSSGISKIDVNNLNPFITSSYGLGETIKHALDNNINKLIIGIGGSSTNDAGSGMLQALGVKFYDNKDQLIKTMNGNTIGLVERIDLSSLDSRIHNIVIEVACDVTNPLLGENGCTYIYAKQKGANKKMLEILENNMEHFSKAVQKTINKDLSNVPGVGAAGGLGFGLLTFMNAKLKSGLEVIAAATKLEEIIKKADIIITGEGSFDHQSLNGKAPIEIARLAKKHHKNVIGIFPLSSITTMSNLFDKIYTVVPSICSLEESLENPQYCLNKLMKTIDLK